MSAIEPAEGASHALGARGSQPRDDVRADLAAVLLCGGRGTRMGAPKATAPFAGRTLLEHTAGRLASHVGLLIVVASADQVLPPLPAGARVARDGRPDTGPLEALVTGLEALAGEAAHAFVTSVDAPFLHPAFVRRMRELTVGLAAVPNVDGRLHPLASVIATAAAPRLRELVRTGERRARSIVGALDARLVSREELLDCGALAAADPELESLTNLNRPEDLAAAERRLRELAASDGRA